jgi:hypothetical protein
MRSQALFFITLSQRLCVCCLMLVGNCSLFVCFKLADTISNCTCKRCCPRCRRCGSSKPAAARASRLYNAQHYYACIILYSVHKVVTQAAMLTRLCKHRYTASMQSAPLKLGANALTTALCQCSPAMRKQQATTTQAQLKVNSNELYSTQKCYVFEC